MKINFSDHRKNGKIVGKKKFIGGRNFQLGSDPEKAERIAAALMAKWQLLKLAGQGWTEEAIVGSSCPVILKPQNVQLELHESPPASAAL